MVYIPDVEFYLNDLADILFQKEYFGFSESAKDYVDRITHYVEENIELHPAKNTPHELSHYGEKYIVYKANDKTSWYIFFSQEESFYFIQYITNNHTGFIANFNL